MDTTLNETQKRLLTTILERGAEGAAQALSQWLGRGVALEVSAVDQVPLEDAAGALGPPDQLVAACGMDLAGALTGQILLVFEDRSGLALVDLLLRQPVGTASEWGDLERSAACETTNIVGCAYLNSLAAHLPVSEPGPGPGPTALVPGPPIFRHEFAASLLEFALMDQAITSDRLLLVDTKFSVDETRLDWTLLFVPSGESIRSLAAVPG